MPCPNPSRLMLCTLKETLHIAEGDLRVVAHLLPDLWDKDSFSRHGFPALSCWVTSLQHQPSTPGPHSCPVPTWSITANWKRMLNPPGEAALSATLEILF